MVPQSQEVKHKKEPLYSTILQYPTEPGAAQVYNRIIHFRLDNKTWQTGHNKLHLIDFYIVAYFDLSYDLRILGCYKQASSFVPDP